MEAVVDTSRQSALHSLMNRDHHYSPPKSSDRGPRYAGEVPRTMTSAMVSPATPYPTHPPHQYAPNSFPPSTNSLSGLISPTPSLTAETRRMSDDKNQSQNGHRMSLPSIHEALGDPKPSGYASAPSAINTNQAYAYSQPPTPTTRPYSMDPSYQTAASRRSSPPHPGHPYARSDQSIPPPAPYETPRHAALPSIRTALPVQSPSSVRPEFPRPEEHRGMPVNGYSHPPPSGQYSGYPAAPNPPSSSTFSPQSPYNTQKSLFPSRYGSEYTSDFSSQESHQNGDVEYNQKHFGQPGQPGQPYKAVVKRNLDYFDIEHYLHDIMVNSNEMARVSSELLTEARRSSHRGITSERNISLQCSAMEQQHVVIAEKLRSIRERVSQDTTDQNLHNPTGQITPYEQDEMGQWTEEGKMGYGAGPDSKKRRGRAAPPGRCHSCNRAETPEWRRGPDGARTLCNACGLHFAKLTRKNMNLQNAKNQASSLRNQIDDGPNRS